MRREGFPFKVWGSEGWGRGRLVNSVPWGLVLGASPGWRRVIGIGHGVVWVAPCHACHWDWWAERRVGGVV